MSVFTRPAPRGRKKTSLKQDLARLDLLDLDADDVETFFRDIDEAKRTELQSLTFRHHAPNTQRKQNSILDSYYSFVKVLRKGELGTDLTPEELDLVAFPPDKEGDGSFKVLTSQLRIFMIYAVENAVPRSLQDEVVGYTTMVMYRRALLFWTEFKFTTRNETPPQLRVLFNALTRAMRTVASKLQMKLKRTPKDKSYLGLAELEQLIDLDTRGTPNIALAEGHHLAWLVGRCCALRPGSIGAPAASGRDAQVPYPFLTFGDFEVTRSSVPGEFSVKLTVRNLKGYAERIGETTGYHTKTVAFYINSPQSQHNMMLSIPHRFLVMALRRGALRDYSTVDELLAGKTRHIMIKKEFEHRPVIVAGTARGLGIVMDKPVPALSLSEYLGNRGQRAGYSQTITFYSIRRRAGTDFVKAVGADNARALMCHEPDTRTLEKFYMQMMPTTDVAALGLSENPGARELQMEMDSNQLAFSRLPPQEVAKRYGKEVNALLRQCLVVDEEYASCTTVKARKNRERVLRRCCLSEFMTQLHEEHKATLTSDDYEQRLDEFMRRATDYNKRLLERIRTTSNNPSSSQASEHEMGLDQNDEVDIEDFNEAADEDGHEKDVDDQLAEDAVEVRTVEEQRISKDVEDYVALLDEVPYLDTVKATMKLLMENGLSEYSKQAAIQCPLCLDDDSMRPEFDEDKFKFWTSKHIAAHMRRNLHLKGRILLRNARNKMKDEERDVMECQFCAEIVPNGVQIPAFASMKLLRKHMDRSNERHIANAKNWTTPYLAKAHDDLKKEYGAYNVDFWGTEANKSKSRAETLAMDRYLRGAAHPELEYSEDKALTAPLVYPGNPGLFMGPFTSYADQSIESGEMRARSLAGVDSIARKLAEDVGGGLPRGVTLGLVPGAETLQKLPQIDSEDTSLLEAVSLPGTSGNFIGQGKRVRDKLDSVHTQRKKARKQ